MKCVTAAMHAAYSLIFIASAYAADPPPQAAGPSPNARAAQLAAACAKVACRQETRSISLRLNAERAVRFQSAPLPYVDATGTVLLYPGDTITVSAVEVGGKLAPIQIVSASTAEGPVNLGAFAKSGATGTVTFAFSQEDGKPDMVLKVTNKSGLMIKYSAMMGVPGPDGLRPTPTSSCPLLPAQGFTGHETWPHPIGMIILSELRIVPANGQMSCN